MKGYLLFCFFALKISKIVQTIVLCTFIVIFQIAHAMALSDLEIDGLIGRMTLEEKVGQLFICGIGGREVGAVPKAHITKRFIGGLILYDKNIRTPEQVAALTTELQKLAQTTPKGIPLFIAIDQEGGKVARLRKGATIFPGNMALGATRSQKLAEKVGDITGIELTVLGINLNLAPVLDVNTHPENPAIGVRSFGDSAQIVSQLGSAYIRGLQRQGVLATAKHFPGHGDTTADSYKELPLVANNRKRIDDVELAPFRAAIDAGVGAIMTAHVHYPELDIKFPATLSHTILNNLLRRELGFEGLIITDDLEMKAIAEQHDIKQAAVAAFQAGADILLVPWTLKKQQSAYNAILRAVKTRHITKSRLDDSVRRILKSKNAYGLFDKNYEHITNPQAINSPLSAVGSKQHRDIAQTIATQAVTIVKNSPGILPLDEAPKQPVLIVSPSRDFSNTFMKAHTELAHVKTVYIPPKVIMRQYIPQLLSSKPSIIIVGIANLQHAKMVHALSRQTSVPVVAVSIDSPYHLRECPNVECAIAAYDDNYFSLLAAIEVLLGRRQATGELPVIIFR